MHSATAGLYNSSNDSICDGGCAQDGVGSSFVPNKSTNDAIGGGGGWRYGMVAPPNTVPMMTPMMAMIAFMLVEVVRKVVAAIWAPTAVPITDKKNSTTDGLNNGQDDSDNDGHNNGMDDDEK